ncbi:hypothetical protein SMD22_00155 (plasmid) [Brevibacillus halotolerans]|nr:hypothetical protein SMD22_00155 [Brevibacillus halotolerans]
MDIRTQILNKCIEFQQFLDGINIEDLNKLSRHELMELEKQLYEVKHRYLGLEIAKIIEAKKIEEFPQILGIHHYPDLQEIDFLNEETKLELDKYLSRSRVGKYVSLYRFSKSNEALQKLENFLIEKGVVERLYVLICPHCSDGYLTKPLLKNELEALEKDIKGIESDEDCEAFETDDHFLLFCMNCEDFPILTKLKEEEGFVVKEVLKLTKKRDTTYDNV